MATGTPSTSNTRKAAASLQMGSGMPSTSNTQEDAALQLSLTPPPGGCSSTSQNRDANAIPGIPQCNNNVLTDDDNLDDEYSSAVDEQDPRIHFKDVIFNKTKDIKNKLTEGKSLTKANKDAILELLIEIQCLTTEFCSSAAKPLNSTCSTSLDLATVAVIRDAIKEEVSKVQQSIDLSIQRQATYADAVKKQTPKPKPVIPVSKPALIISPKIEVSSPAETFNAWKKKISFRDTNFSPSNIQYISNNKLRVEFDTVEHRETALAKTNQPDSEVTAEISKKLQPMVIIKGISAEVPPEELVDIICKQNECVKSLISNDKDLVYKFSRRNRKEHLYNAVFMVSPVLWRTLIKEGKLNIDFQRVHLEDHAALLQCYNCLQFGHTSKICSSESRICSHCSSLTHEFKTCPFKHDKSKINCYNCTQFYKKHNLNIDKTNHSATSENCPRVLHMLQRIRSRTDYGY